MRTVGWRGDDALLQRHPVNANIQKTADDSAEREKRRRPKMKGHTCPGPRVEYHTTDYHRCFSPAPRALFAQAPFALPTIRAPAHPDTATCRAHSLSGIRLLLPPSTAASLPA